MTRRKKGLWATGIATIQHSVGEWCAAGGIVLLPFPLTTTSINTTVTLTMNMIITVIRLHHYYCYH